MKLVELRGTTFRTASLDASEINGVLEELPVAQEYGIKAGIFREDGSFLPAIVPRNFKAIAVKDRVIAVPTTDFKLVQHKDGFRPLVDAFSEAGIRDFKFSVYGNDKKATIEFYVGGTGYDNVLLGIKSTNFLDSHGALRYGFDLSHNKDEIKFVGYRLACQNGLVAIVPLNRAEIIRPSLATKIRSLFQESVRLTHTKHIEEKIKAIKYVAEALALLREPFETMIRIGEGVKLTEEKVKKLVKLHVKKRYAKRVLAQLEQESGLGSPTVWDLYNAITYIASHEDLSVDSSQELKERAGRLLVACVKNKLFTK